MGLLLVLNLLEKDKMDRLIIQYDHFKNRFAVASTYDHNF